jgi:hypothetical protein
MIMTVSQGDLRGATLLAINYHVRCACGAEWILAKSVKR